MGGAAKAVQEFVGVIDGGGYKRSFDDPKKVPLDLIPPTLSYGIGRVLGKGAKKYAPGNWMRGMSWSGILAAIERHLKAIQAGEDVDADTGELHIYCIGCEIAFLSWFMEGPWAPAYKAYDDRMFRPDRLVVEGEDAGCICTGFIPDPECAEHGHLQGSAELIP